MISIVSYIQNNKETSMIILIILIGLIFVLCQSKIPNVEKFGLNEQKINLNEYKVDMAKCSPDCCTSQWPVPFYKHGLKDNSEFVGNSYRCSNGVTSGCPCLTRKQVDFIASRGGNYPIGYEPDEQNSIPEEYIIKPENHKHPFYNGPGPLTGYVVNDGNMYALPNNGLIVDTNSLILSKEQQVNKLNVL
jgi:hypothetical protein